MINHHHHHHEVTNRHRNCHRTASERGSSQQWSWVETSHGLEQLGKQDSIGTISPISAAILT